jgi:hypothetical protein
VVLVGSREAGVEARRGCLGCGLAAPALTLILLIDSATLGRSVAPIWLSLPPVADGQTTSRP